MKQFTLIGPFKQLITMDQLPMRGPIKDEQLQVINNAALILSNNEIIDVLLYEDALNTYPIADSDIIKIDYDAVVLPAFIDAHTHICFAGSRANDFAMRNAGKSYLEIAKTGGGIWDTVTKTRAASKPELVDGIAKRLQKMVQSGIGTVEVKSGYGLSVVDEIKMLEAIKEANQNSNLDLISTCLAAHIKPRDFSGSHQEYLNHITNELLPLILKNGLSNRLDVFIEEEAFDLDISKTYLKNAKKMGFDLTVHADQFHTGGSAVATEVGALSADHLEASTENEIALLGKSSTIAMALPGATLGLGCAFTPARKLLDAGASLGIASDWNPGSGPMGDLITQASILATFEKLSTAEVFAGVTFRAAAALNLFDRGVIKKGKKADFVIYKTPQYQEVLYHQGQLKPCQLWKNGECIYSSNL